MIQNYLKDLNIDLNPHSFSDKDKFIFTAKLELIAEKCKDEDMRYELALFDDFINKKIKNVYIYNKSSHNIIINNSEKIPLIDIAGVIHFFDKDELFVMIDIIPTIEFYNYNDIATKYYKGE